MSSSYPPPPTRRRLPPEPKPEPDTKSTLYSSSPHHKLDAKARKARHYTDPTWALLSLLALALIYWSWPGVEKPWTPRSNKASSSVPACNCQQSASTMPWQTTFTLSSPGKGCHLVTNEVSKHIAEGLKGTKVGILHLFIQHTSAGLSINENFDRDVRTDMTMAFDKIVPDSWPWVHTDEGPDDSSSHTKATLCGSSVSVPITDGRLNLGTWQGIYLCEFRKAKHSRRIVATVTP